MHCMELERNHLQKRKIASKVTYMDVYGLRCKLAKNEQGQSISSHLDRTSFVNKGFIIWPLAKFFLRDTVSSPEQAAHLGSQLQHRIQFILPAYKASHIISTDK